MPILTTAEKHSYDEKCTYANNTITVDGDSIAGLAVSADELKFSSTASINWANAFLGQRFTITKDYGVGGNNTTQILARLDTTLADPSKYIHYIMGTNDVYQNEAYSTITANMLEIFEKTIETGKICIASTILPARDATYDSAQLDLLARVNKYIVTLSQTLKNYIVVDYHSVTVNPLTGSIKDDYTSDDLHPSAYGGFYMGKELARVLENITPIVSCLVDSNIENTSQVMANSLMIGGATKASGWGFIGDNATFSKEVLEDGNELQVIVSTDEETQLIYRYVDGSFYQDGDVFYAVTEVEVTNITTLDSVSLRLEAKGGDYTENVSTMLLAGATVIRFPDENYNAVLRTPNLTIPPNTTGLLPWFQSAMNGTLKINKIQIVKVD